MAPSGKLSDLGIRAASALVMVAAALASTYAGGVVFEAVWLAAAAAVHWEWQRLVGGTRLRARLVAGGIGLVALVVGLHLRGNVAAVVACVGLAVVGAEAALAGPGRRAWAASGFLYAAMFVSAVIVLRSSVPDGVRAILWLFATVWATDVFAYFGGRLIGGPKLWPRVSPSKTWSGTLTGVVCGGVLGTLLAGPPTLPIFALTVVTAAVSQAGDAMESAIKRRFGVKDTSRLIPGHGGAMDRLDGFIAASIFALAVAWPRASASVAHGLFQWT